MSRKRNQHLCPMCGGDCVAGRITSTTDLDSSVVVVRNVPATVCDQCGEEWLDDATVRKLEEFAADAKAHGTLVEVRSMAS